MGSNVSIRFGALFECKPPLFERSDDLTARFGGNEYVVGEISSDEEDRADETSGMIKLQTAVLLTFQPEPVDSSALGPFGLHLNLLLLQKSLRSPRRISLRDLLSIPFHSMSAQ